MRKYMSTLRGENEELGEAVLSALTDHGEVEHLYTIHWRVRQNRRAYRFDFHCFRRSRSTWRRGATAMNRAFRLSILTRTASNPIRRSARLSLGK
jgi:hypothetical protein